MKSYSTFGVSEVNSTVVNEVVTASKTPTKCFLIRSILGNRSLRKQMSPTLTFSYGPLLLENLYLLMYMLGHFHIGIRINCTTFINILVYLLYQLYKLYKHTGLHRNTE